MNHQQPKSRLARVTSHPTFHVLATLAAVLGIIWGWNAVLQSEIDLEQAKWNNARQTWVKCGKPFGHPCDCPKEGCLCGIVKGRSCPNCRPMREPTELEKARRKGLVK